MNYNANEYQGNNYHSINPTVCSYTINDSFVKVLVEYFWKSRENRSRSVLVGASWAESEVMDKCANELWIYSSKSLSAWIIPFLLVPVYRPLHKDFKYSILIPLHESSKIISSIIGSLEKSSWGNCFGISVLDCWLQVADFQNQWIRDCFEHRLC